MGRAAAMAVKGLTVGEGQRGRDIAQLVRRVGINSAGEVLLREG